MDNVPSVGQIRNPNISEVVPEALRALKRWTHWVYAPAKKKGAKPAKKPLTLTNDSSTWLMLDEALTAAGQAHGGVGFQMLGATAICGIDLDGCYDPTTGALSAFARALLDQLSDTYAEISPSGKGIRVLASIPDGMRVPEFLNNTHGVECYCGKSARYLTITGNVLPGREGKFSDLTREALSLFAPLVTAGNEVEVEIKLPVPAIERLPRWQEMFDDRLPWGKLKKDLREYLEAGDIPGSRSEKTFAVACKLIECRFMPDEAFAILVSAPGTWEAALDKRDQDPTRARALIWADIGRAQKMVRADSEDAAARESGWADLGLRTEVKGKLVQVQRTQMNLARVLTDHEEWRNRIALDITSGLVLLDGTPLDDMRLFLLMERVGAFCHWDPGLHRQWWTDTVRAVAEKNQINPREQELRQLKWDGKNRLDTWLTEHVAASDNELNRIIGRKFILSCVARWISPGCKVDTVLILQGVEGARKNTLLEVLAGSPERVCPINGFERDDKFTAAQAWLVEMPEASIFRRADRNRLKSFITEPIDQYRPPYAATPVKVKRAFVLVSTANHFDALFNADQDGLRRFWPVEVRSRIDYEWVRENRDQLLAEAVLAYDLEEHWWFDETPQALKDLVEGAVETTVVDEALDRLIVARRGLGGMALIDIISEVSAIIGYRPNDRMVSALLPKHGLRKARSSGTRFWLHPTWARPGHAGEAHVIPLTRGGEHRDAASVAVPESAASVAVPAAAEVE